MTILNISLPESIQAFVAQQVDKGGYGTVNEYILDLLRQEKAKAEQIESFHLVETEYLLSSEANRDQLMTAIQNIESKTNLVSFTPEEWNKEYNI